MKSILSMISVATIAAVASLAPIAHAQSTLVSARVNVPFSFEYGTRQLPAGTYTISMSDDSLVTLSGATGTAIAMADVDLNSREVSATQVTFNKYGKSYFLEGLTIDGMGAEATVIQSQRERSLAKEWAMSSQVPERQALALLLAPRLGN